MSDSVLLLLFPGPEPPGYSVYSEQNRRDVSRRAHAPPHVQKEYVPDHVPEQWLPQDLHSVYQRDRDRILHCKAFRRLKDKTQVFLAPQGDHYRNRLTHTLEV